MADPADAPALADVVEEAEPPQAARGSSEGQWPANRLTSRQITMRFGRLWFDADQQEFVAHCDVHSVNGAVCQRVRSILGRSPSGGGMPCGALGLWLERAREDDCDREGHMKMKKASHERREDFGRAVVRRTRGGKDLLCCETSGSSTAREPYRAY